MSEPVRVIIADDELISRGYMEMFIQPSPRYEIAASLPRAQDVVDWCRKNGPADLAVKASRANIVVSDEDRLNGMGN